MASRECCARQRAAYWIGRSFFVTGVSNGKQSSRRARGRCTQEKPRTPGAPAVLAWWGQVTHCSSRCRGEDLQPKMLICKRDARPSRLQDRPSQQMCPWTSLRRRHKRASRASLISPNYLFVNNLPAQNLLNSTLPLQMVAAWCLQAFGLQAFGCLVNHYLQNGLP